MNMLHVGLGSKRCRLDGCSSGLGYSDTDRRTGYLERPARLWAGAGRPMNVSQTMLGSV